VPALPELGGPAFDNLDPSLENAWHPVALSRELRPGGWIQVRLLGRTWTLRRDDDAVSVEPPAFGVRERLGLIWLAPAEPADVALDVPEAADRRFVPTWPLPVRSPGPAGPLADTFLDATHGPFVHAGTIGTPDQAEVTAPQVTAEPGGFNAVVEQWCDNPLDPEVATGERPLRQRRRTTYTYRAPLQLRLRQEFLDSGATTTIVYLLQPEDLDSTRIYLVLLQAAGPGMPLPAPAEVAAQAALQHEILEEDVRSQAALAITGLPLDLRNEVHVPADRLGVALRQALCDFLAAGRRQEAAA
jgi:phenylpropionate dioxygenase-like ring-hydroxylating dioxygenase large terminal subunit